MGGAGGSQRRDIHGQLDMCPKGIITNGNKDLLDAHPSIIYTSREGETLLIGRNCFCKL